MGKKQHRVFTLHGWSFNASVWRGTSFEKAVHFHLPGHGNSDFESTELTELSEEVAVVLPEGSTLVGWSLGASVALITAHLFPKKVEKLILFSPTLKFSGISQPVAVVKRFLKKLEKDFSKGVDYFRSLCSEERLPIPELEEEKAIKLLESFCHLDLSPFTNLKATTLIVVGNRDEITKLSGARALFDRISGKKGLQVLPGNDHLTVLFNASPLL